jgi:hypothetical protein
LGGAKKPDLIAPGSDFPIGDDGKPTFRPPAGWYLSQFDVQNVVSGTLQKVDEQILTTGDDLVLHLRLQGEFFEQMELAKFPFDTQDLQVMLMVNCRTTGPVPVQFDVADDIKTAAPPAGFQLHGIWELVRKSEDNHRGALAVTPYYYGPADRQFPAVQLTVKVRRISGFYMVNVVAPMFCFVLLSLLQWVVPRTDAVSRLGISLTLVLTAAAYKLAVSTMVPAISYLTLLDKYVVLCWSMIMLAAFEGGLLAIPDEDSAAGDFADRCCLLALAGAFALGHVLPVRDVVAASIETWRVRSRTQPAVHTALVVARCGSVLT